MKKTSPSQKQAVRSLSMDFGLIRLWAQEDAAAERHSREHMESIRIKAAEKRAIEKAREQTQAQEKERLIELTRREADSLQLPRRIMAWNESSARGGISIEALETILSIQSQMIAAFLALVDKKVPLLAPGARLSAVEENYASRTFFSKARRSAPLPPANHSVQKRSNSTVPNMFSKKRVSFSLENAVVVFSRSSTPSLRR